MGRTQQVGRRSVAAGLIALLTVFPLPECHPGARAQGRDVHDGDAFVVEEKDCACLWPIHSLDHILNDRKGSGSG
jgi:hypothetical protein